MTRIEYERIRKERLKVAKKLEEAEEEEDAITEKLLEHRRKIRRLRKQLRMKESHEHKAREKEEASIADAERVEEEFLLVDPVDPIPMDLPSFTPTPLDGRLLMSPAGWSEIDGTPWGLLGQAEGLLPDTLVEVESL